MNTYTHTHPAARLATRASGFLSGGWFPAFAISALVFYQIFIAVMAFTPPTAGVWGDFLEDFRLRCFRLDPSSRQMDMPSIWIMLSEPLPLQMIFFVLWRAPLQDLWRQRRRAFAQASVASAALVLLIAASLLGLGRAQAAKKELPFPAENLRTALPMPDFHLTNQDGRSVSLGDFKGRVVLVTAVYSTCTSTCPMMLGKMRSVLDKLTDAERAQMSVVAFSLNPEADTRELRSMVAQMYGMQAPFHFVNGIPSEVNAILDKLNIARTRDAATSQIQHSNLFFLLDREGRIAYRLSLSQNESSWLLTALRTLLSEKTR